jgi:two-component system chemotaxis response regulator CheB
MLPNLLDQAGPLRAAAAVEGEALEPGRIYVCVPDRHLMIESGRIRLPRGPKESHARPSVDVLFRSAAVHAGPRVIGIVLTGQLDDGSAGLWAIKDRGGMAMVQSPDEAPFPSMPQNAIRQVRVDYTLPIAGMPEILDRLTREALPEAEKAAMSDDKLAIETRIALADDALKSGVRSLGTASFHTCPECHGSMVRIQDGPITRFRCHTGHGFTQAALEADGLDQIEKTLYGALAQVEEYEALLVDLQVSAQPRRAQQLSGRIEEVRAFIERLRAVTLDPTLSGARTAEQADSSSDDSAAAGNGSEGRARA